MAQVAFSIRMDEELKRDFGRFCEEVGMSMSTAFTVFAKEAVREQKIPFEVGTRARPHPLAAFHALRAQAQERFKDQPEPTLDEINDIIAETPRSSKPC
jgi:addiction module RelB/DinJ family antitoxin